MNVHDNTMATDVCSESACHSDVNECAESKSDYQSDVDRHEKKVDQRLRPVANKTKFVVRPLDWHSAKATNLGIIQSFNLSTLVNAN